jgi:hypothetical protein
MTTPRHELRTSPLRPANTTRNALRAARPIAAGRAARLLALAGCLLAPSCDGRQDADRGDAPAEDRSGDAPIALDASEGGPFSAEPPVVELGEGLVPGAPVTRTITLRNGTGRQVRVVKAIADCGCTTPTWPTDPIPPGGTAEADLKLDPPKTQGAALVKRVTFILDEGEPLVVELHGTVGRFVMHDPETVVAPGDGETAPTATPILLESADGTPFRVLAAEPLVLAELAREPALRHELRIDWDRWRAARKPVKFTITTDHPKAPPLMVVIRRKIQPAPPSAPTTP